MHQDEGIQVAGTMTDYLIKKLKDTDQGRDFAFEYFKSAFLAAAANALFYMRRQAGLTQAQVAERMNTKQSAVARLEGDFDGGISLRRYVDFALACDMVPHNITFAPLESVISYTIAQTKIPYTQVNHHEWLKTNSWPSITCSENVAHVKSNFEMLSQVHQAQSQAVFSLETSLERSSANSTSTASYATTLPEDILAHEYFQPPLMRPLQLLQGGHVVSTTSEHQTKTLNLDSSKTNQGISA